jgi:hypothetical protein
MEIDRSIRRLTALENSASTARVLNLLATHRRFPDDEELARNPFFKNRLLNRSIILKHRLRPHEYANFATPRPTVTKVLLPIDGTDLRAGAHSFFVGQGAFDALVEQTFGDDLKPGSRDRQVLELIDTLPSLDPFLLREHLRTNDLEPARAYFSISDADVQRMVEFVREEILALVVLSTGQKRGSHASAARLVDKLLSNSPDQVFAPLRDTLGLSDQQYQDGVFSWRGFLYYKWVFTDLSGPLNNVLSDITRIQGRGPKNIETAAYLSGAKTRIQAKLLQAHVNVRTLLNVYDEAYAALTSFSNPGSFRNFLLSAPAMFTQLGEQLGAIQHVISFWSYRLPAGKPRLISHDELADLFLDFEDGLTGVPADGGQIWTI